MPDNPADSHVLSELIDDVAELLGIEEHDEEDSELLLASISGGLWAILMQDGMVWIEPLEAALDASEQASLEPEAEPESEPLVPLRELLERARSELGLE